MSSEFDFFEEPFVTEHDTLVPLVDEELHEPPQLSFQHYVSGPEGQLPPTRLPLTAPIGSCLSGIMRRKFVGGPKVALPVTRAANPEAEPVRRDDASAPAAVAAGDAGQPQAAQEVYQWAPIRRGRREWTTSETDEFYDALAQFGVNFNLVAVMFPGKSRDDIVHKYKTESRKCPNRLQAALQAENQKAINVEKFEACKQQCDALRAGPARVLDADEEAHLQAIDFELGAAASPAETPNDHRQPKQEDTAIAVALEESDWMTGVVQTQAAELMERGANRRTLPYHQPHVAPPQPADFDFASDFGVELDQPPPVPQQSSLSATSIAKKGRKLAPLKRTRDDPEDLAPARPSTTFYSNIAAHTTLPSTLPASAVPTHEPRPDHEDDPWGFVDPTGVNTERPFAARIVGTEAGDAEVAQEDVGGLFDDLVDAAPLDDVLGLAAMSDSDALLDDMDDAEVMDTGFF